MTTMEIMSVQTTMPGWVSSIVALFGIHGSPSDLTWALSLRYTPKTHAKYITMAAMVKPVATSGVRPRTGGAKGRSVVFMFIRFHLQLLVEDAQK